MQEERLAVMYPCIEEIINREGGYWDDPLGGPTNMGITHRTLARWRGKNVTAEDVEALTRAEAREIYEEKYIDEPGFGGIHDPFTRGHVVDAGVLHGTGTATRWLQETAGVTVDYAVGPITLGAVNRAGKLKFNVEIAGRRIRYIGHIVQVDPKEKLDYVEGWLIRATAFLWP